MNSEMAEHLMRIHTRGGSGEPGFRAVAREVERLLLSAFAEVECHMEASFGFVSGARAAQVVREVRDAFTPVAVDSLQEIQERIDALEVPAPRARHSCGKVPHDADCITTVVEP